MKSFAQTIRCAVLPFRNRKENALTHLFNSVVTGDCIEVLKTFPDESIDMVLTDPPYVTQDEEPRLVVQPLENFEAMVRRLRFLEGEKGACRSAPSSSEPQVQRSLAKVIPFRRD